MKSKVLCSLLFLPVLALICVFYVQPVFASPYDRFEYTKHKTTVKMVLKPTAQNRVDELPGPGELMVQWFTSVERQIDEQQADEQETESENTSGVSLRLCFNRVSNLSTMRSPLNIKLQGVGDEHSLRYEGVGNNKAFVFLQSKDDSGSAHLDYNSGDWYYDASCSVFTNTITGPNRVSITRQNDHLIKYLSKNKLIPYEKPEYEKKSGDLLATGGSFSHYDDKGDFYKRPGGNRGVVVYEWLLKVPDILMTMTGGANNHEEEPVTYLVVWYDAWRNIEIPIPAHLFSTMQLYNHHRDPAVLGAIASHPQQTPQQTYEQFMRENPGLNFRYRYEDLPLSLKELNRIELLPGLPPAPIGCPGGANQNQEPQSQNIGAEGTVGNRSTNPVSVTQSQDEADKRNDGNNGEKGGGGGEPDGSLCSVCGHPKQTNKLICQNCNSVDNNPQGGGLDAQFVALLRPLSVRLNELPSNKLNTIATVASLANQYTELNNFERLVTILVNCSATKRGTVLKTVNNLLSSNKIAGKAGAAKYIAEITKIYEKSADTPENDEVARLHQQAEQLAFSQAREEERAERARHEFMRQLNVFVEPLEKPWFEDQTQRSGRNTYNIRSTGIRLATPDGARPHSSHTSGGLQVKTGTYHGMSFQQLTAAFSDSFLNLNLTENQRHELMEYGRIGIEFSLSDEFFYPDNTGSGLLTSIYFLPDESGAHLEHRVFNEFNQYDNHPDNRDMDYHIKVTIANKAEGRAANMLMRCIKHGKKEHPARVGSGLTVDRLFEYGLISIEGNQEVFNKILDMILPK